MKSKEALFNLVRIHYGYENKNDFDECVSELEKDLERLEKLEKVIKILKHRIDFENLGEFESGYVFRGYFNDCFDEDEYELLKEWLL